jgi:maltose O-acetyltransferase
VVVADRVRLEGAPIRIDLFAGRGAELSIGEGTYINYGVNVGATESVTIGRECAIGQLAILLDNDFHVPGSLWQRGKPQPVVVEDGVWIGAQSIILPGTRIGKGSVIGANSVVSGSIPPGVIAAGSPARVIRQLESP